MRTAPPRRHTDMDITIEAEVAAAATGDEAAFGALAARHRRELHVHCYRMLGSFEEAEDLVQETFLRAWRRRETFAGRASLRAWLYGIATNACLDALERRRRAPEPSGEVLWLQPYPDALLDEVPDREPGPADRAIARETIELAFLVALQHVPPRPRAVFVLRDVLGWSAPEAADLLGCSVAAVTSGLQRARETVRRRLPERRLEWAPGTAPDPALQALLQRYVDASESGDVAALAETLHDELRWWMPPQPGMTTTRDEAVEAWVGGGFGSDSWGPMRCTVTWVNRQPTVANYVRRPGDDAFRAMALDVLRIEDGRVAECVTFPPSAFALTGLPETL